jgi:hypothetical protein
VRRRNLVFVNLDLQAPPQSLVFVNLDAPCGNSVGHRGGGPVLAPNLNGAPASFGSSWPSESWIGHDNSHQALGFLRQISGLRAEKTCLGPQM